jgi:MoxR-like ATPase
MPYAPIFDPRTQAAQRGPRTDAVAYVYDHDPAIVLAVNVALAARRPLLLRGDPGTGKSSLSEDVAHCLGRRHLKEVVTSRTQARDLEWRFDAVRRLGDAQAGKDVGGVHDTGYLEPGILWRAFHPESASEYGSRRTDHARGPAVVLLDEIDKADPDVPNDLLVVLDARWFDVPEIGRRVEAPPDLDLLLVLTTNGERELPPAFVRRCVVCDLKLPDTDSIKVIARRHIARWAPGLTQDAALDGLLDELLGLLATLRAEADRTKQRLPSLAELLDAVHACVGLGIADAKDARWAQIAEAALWKHAPRGKDRA